MQLRWIVAGGMLVAACGADEPNPVGVTDLFGSVVRPGIAAHAGAQVKDYMPAFAPLYPGTHLEQNSEGNYSRIYGDKGPTWRIGGTFYFTVSERPAEIAGFYRTRAEAAGLRTLVDAAADGERIFHAKDGLGRRSVSLKVRPLEDGSARVELRTSNLG